MADKTITIASLRRAILKQQMGVHAGMKSGVFSEDQLLAVCVALDGILIDLGQPEIGAQDMASAKAS